MDRKVSRNKRKIRGQNLSQFCHLQIGAVHLSHLSPSTSEDVGAPQMMLQHYISFPPFRVFRCPQGISKHHSRHSLILPSHLFFCLPLLLAPFTVPCRIVFAMPEDLEMWPYHLSFRFFTMVRRSSCTPTAYWILLRTSSYVTLSL